MQEVENGRAELQLLRLSSAHPRRCRDPAFELHACYTNTAKLSP